MRLVRTLVSSSVKWGPELVFSKCVSRPAAAPSYCLGMESGDMRVVMQVRLQLAPPHANFWPTSRWLCSTRHLPRISFQTNKSKTNTGLKTTVICGPEGTCLSSHSSFISSRDWNLLLLRFNASLLYLFYILLACLSLSYFVFVWELEVCGKNTNNSQVPLTWLALG